MTEWYCGKCGTWYSGRPKPLLILSDLEDRLREIDQIVWTPTPKGWSAFVHFQRDWDRIRELTKPWHTPLKTAERES